VFSVFVADLAEPVSAATGAAQLIEQGIIIDQLILNAGMSTGTQPRFNSDGVELTFASALIGHHVLTMRLLDAGLLSSEARIVIAGSEGARGDVPGMKPVQFEAFAGQHFGGDLETAMETVARAQAPFTFHPMNAYVTAKLFVAWWAAALARRLPAGMAVYAISPGSVPSTNFARYQSFMMRGIIMPLMEQVGHLFGLASPTAAGAQRYIDGGLRSDLVNGRFYASAPGKMTGPLQLMVHDHFIHEGHQEAFWRVLARLTGQMDLQLMPAQYDQMLAR
jgi:NAD(P)-dependent dehydrogenase (short-subunit alcohol dehydrogenase family)